MYRIKHTAYAITIYFYFISIFFKFTYFERDSASGEGQRERGRGRIPSTLHAASTEPNAGLEPMKRRDHDLSRNQESGCLTDKATQVHLPTARPIFLFYFFKVTYATNLSIWVYHGDILKATVATRIGSF